jgi:hypothetical protein
MACDVDTTIKLAGEISKNITRHLEWLQQLVLDGKLDKNDPLIQASFVLQNRFNQLYESVLQERTDLWNSIKSSFTAGASFCDNQDKLNAIQKELEKYSGMISKKLNIVDPSAPIISEEEGTATGIKTMGGWELATWAIYIGAGFLAYKFMKDSGMLTRISSLFASNYPKNKLPKYAGGE